MAVEATTKANNKTTTQKDKFLSIYSVILFIALALLIFYPPYLRGLFFEQELLPTHIYSFVLFLLFLGYKYLKKDYAIFKTKLDYAAGGMVLAFLLPVLFGQSANLKNAIAEVLKYCNFFAVYIMVRDLSAGERSIKAIINVLLASAVGVALFGIDATAGEHIQKFIGDVIGYKFFDGYVGGRLSSTLQYPNTLAAYLMAIFFIALGMQLENKKLWQKAMYGKLAFLLFFTFMLTYSRGAMMFFPFVYLLFIVVLLNINKIIEAVLSSGIIFIISALLLQPVTSAISGKNTLRIWVLVLIGGLAATLFSFLAGLIARLVGKLNKKAVLLGSISVLSVVSIVVTAGVAIVLNTRIPLELKHDSTEAAVYRRFNKIIPNIESDAEYTLLMRIQASTADEKQWACRLVINSLDDDGKSTQIESVSYYNEDAYVDIPFNTREDTQAIRLTINNYYPDTSLKIDDVKLTPANGKSRHITLKYKYIPDMIISRFDDLIMGSRNTSQRIVYYRDGFKILRDFPIFGAGGKAWESLYFKYQSYWYYSTQAHNYFLQTFVETGIIGFGVLLAFLGLFLYACMNNIKKIPDSIITRMLGITVITLLLHSIIDFDLSLAAVFLVVWIGAGIISAINLGTKEMQRTKKRRFPAEMSGCAILFIAALILSINFTVAPVYAQKAVKAVEDKDIELAQKHYETAIKYDPFKSAYRIDLARVYNALSREKDDNNETKIDNETVEKAEKMALSAISCDRYNSLMYALTGSVYMANGKVEEGLKFVDKSVEYQPMKSLNYQQKADAYFKAGVFYLNRGEQDKALQMFKVVADIEPYLEELNKGIKKPVKLNEDTIKIIESNAKIIETLLENQEK